MIGIIKALNSERGWGFIKVPQSKDLFFHSSATTGFDDLAVGQVVEYEIIEGRRGPAAGEVRATGEKV